MTKEDILKLYIADLNNLVADSDAKRSRIIDLEDELEALKQGQSLPIDSVIVAKRTCCLNPKKIGKVNDMFESWDECKNCGKEIV